jgi:hypothetical protein
VGTIFGNMKDESDSDGAETENREGDEKRTGDDDDDSDNDDDDDDDNIIGSANEEDEVDNYGLEGEIPER